MKVKEVYALFQAELGPTLEALGYEKASKSGRRPLWARPHGESFALICIFGDKYPYDAPIGGAFGVKATLAAQPTMTDDDWNDAKHLTNILNAQELAQMTRVRDRVLRKILRQKKSVMTAWERAVFDSFRGILEYDLDYYPYQKDHEERCQYHDKADLAEWCKFLRTMLPRIDAAITSPPRGLRKR